MAPTHPLQTKLPLPSQLEQLRRLSTCVVASAIETANVRLPNTGFAHSDIRCIFEGLPPVAAHAATARVRTAAPPIEGGRYSYARTDWWDHLLAIPAPRILVIQDMDTNPGLGAFIGEVHSNILLAMSCVGVVTNGAVRDLPEVRPTGFYMFAGNVSVSHAYAHVLDFGGPVEVGGLKIHPGELIHGDVHGIQTVPIEAIDEILSAANEIMQTRRHLVGICHSPGITLERLREAVKIDLQPKKGPNQN